MAEPRETIVPEHLGDGVYVHDEGYMLELAVNHHENKVICLELSTFIALIEYAKRAGFYSPKEKDK